MSIIQVPHYFNFRSNFFAKRLRFYYFDILTVCEQFHNEIVGWSEPQ